MNEIKKTILETAISLFAEKGFHGTSIQDITNKSNISKGAFYLHFKSKDDLLVEIFQYYVSEFETRSLAAVDSSNTPKECFAKQIEVYLSEVMLHRDFILMSIRENSFTLNKRLLAFFQEKNSEMFHWYTDTLISIYGEEIEPFTPDMGILVEGIKSSYLQVFLATEQPFSTSAAAKIITHLCDSLAAAFLSQKYEPIIAGNKVHNLFNTFAVDESIVTEKVLLELERLQTMLESSTLGEDIQEELLEAIEFLKSELTKPKLNKVVIQGVLANFKPFKQFDDSRRFISNALQIKLL